MSIHDLSTGPAPTEIEADVCIVGSGPAGMTIALELDGLPLRVCILESGGLNRDDTVEALNEIETVGARRAPQDVTRARGLGGTSSVWTGRCGAFDIVDFQRRPWVDLSGWPISHDDVSPLFDRAGRLLGLGPAIYDHTWPDLIGERSDARGWDSSLFRPVVFQYSQAGAARAEPARTFVADGVAGAENIGALQHAGAPTAMHFGEAHRAALHASRTVDVWLNANVTEIETDDTGCRVTGVAVRSLNGRSMRVKAPLVVLACGGIDNARLMLASRAGDPRGVGNAHDTVGRFLTDHPLAKVATYSDAGDARLRRRYGHRWFDRNGNRHVYSLGMRLSPVVQRAEGLLNCAVHVLEYGERPATVSLAGRAGRALRRGRLDAETMADLRAVASDPRGLLTGVYDRYVLKRPALAPPTSIAFCCAVEQVLDPASRVTLSDTTDALGMPRARIDWKVSDTEFATVQRTTELLFAEMGRLGFRLPTLAAWLAEGPDGYRSAVHDMAHPMSSTRMSDSPTTGVVDRNCKVHGVEGLFVAGSSVFSTPGYMNPTMMIVALSLRLADHLKRQLAGAALRDVSTDSNSVTSADATPAKVPASAVAPRRTRIGLIGAGDRLRRIYVPVLSADRDVYEIVGFAGRSPAGAEAFAADTGLTRFEDAGKLVADARPDMLVAAVSPGAVDGVLPGIVALGVPVLTETPFCWNVRSGRALAQVIRKRNLLVGVAEQTPFLPHEQIKRILAELGLLGRIVAASNDFAVFDYHGIAALRAYAEIEAAPVAVSAVRAELAVDRAAAGGHDLWTSAVIEMSSGARLFHQYSDRYFDSPQRPPKALRVLGTRGSIFGDEIRYEDPQSGPVETRISRIVDGNRLVGLRVEAPGGTIAWDNPFARHPFSDEQIAVAALVRAMARAIATGGVPAYGADRALVDMEVMTSIRLSAEAGGRSIPVPVSGTELVARAGAGKVVRRLRRGS